MHETSDDRFAKWMVGDRLSCVLHVGDFSMAYRLADQGHDVVVVGDDVSSRRHRDISYVRSAGERLPFVSSAFDAVIVPHLSESPLALSEYARVLRGDGLLSTLSHRHDESIPWLRKLRDIIGDRDVPPWSTKSLTASGLFHEPEVVSGGSWEKLDLEELTRFARANRHPSVPDASLARVRELFESYASHNGHLQLRHETTCLRARVDKSQLEPESEPDQVLLDFH